MEQAILQAIRELREDMTNRFTAVDEKFTSIDNQFKSIDNRFEAVNEQLKEHTQILRALEHSVLVQRAEQDKMTHTLAQVQGEVMGIRKDLNNVTIVTASNWADITHLKAAR